MLSTMEMKIIRNTCPRNCYGACSILSYVSDEHLVKITGDPKHGFTEGHLCAKGYAYTQYVYNPARLKYPMLQTPRGSGNWMKISWEEAYSLIAEKILELHDRYHSNLSCGYNKYTGNLGLLHYAVEGMFNSIGPHTKGYGDICLATGEEAARESFGGLISPIPEDMANSKLIVIWGANPAVTNVHQMKFIYTAQQKGAQLIVIDPLYTDTARKADIYIQIKPGTDAWLALGISKILLSSYFKPEAIKRHFNGWEDFRGIIKGLDLDMVAHETGISRDLMEELARLYGTIKPIATWNGIGIQRNRFGAQSIKAINSLAALSGNINLPHGGVYFVHEDTRRFPLSLGNLPEKKHPAAVKSRAINLNNFAQEANHLTDPPLKFLWIASRNPLEQDHQQKAWQKLFNQLELIVTVDLFMTETAKQSDLVLPAASFFEEEDLHVGYWHHWISINQKSIPPFYEAKSDLLIARELSAKLNELSPGFSSFPSELEPLEWIEKELADGKVHELYGINSYDDLLAGPVHRKPLEEKLMPFSFIQQDDLAEMVQHVSHMKNRKSNAYPFRLLTPQTLLKHHSQFSSISWLQPHEEETVVEINEENAKKLQIKDGTTVKIFNELGAVSAKARINKYLPSYVILANLTSDNLLNKLAEAPKATNKEPTTTFFYDVYVNLKLVIR